MHCNLQTVLPWQHVVDVCHYLCLIVISFVFNSLVINIWSFYRKNMWLNIICVNNNGTKITAYLPKPIRSSSWLWLFYVGKIKNGRVPAACNFAGSGWQRNYMQLALDRPWARWMCSVDISDIMIHEYLTLCNIIVLIVQVNTARW